MNHPLRIASRFYEQQLSAMTLSSAAEAGTVARDLGFLPARQLTPPARRQLTPASVLYVWSAPEPRSA